MKQFFRKYFWFLFGEQVKPVDIKFHPKTEKPIKWVMNVGGMDLYEFVNTYEMPRKRFAFAQKFFVETQNKCTTEYLNEFIEACKATLNKSDIGNTFKLLDELQYRTKWLFEPETLLRFASVMYFTLDEDITDYDFEFNETKIHAFKKKNTLESFLQLLTNGQSILKTLSSHDLAIYLSQLKEQTEKQQTLISDLKAK